MQFCTQNPLAGNHDKLRIMQIAAAWISEEYYLPYKEKLNLNFWSSPGSWLLREKIMLNGKNSKKLYVCIWLHGLLLDQLIQICLLQCDFFSIALNLLCINVSYVMEFLAWWVLKSKVFAQKSTVVKWNCCILSIDIPWGLQNWA